MPHERSWWAQVLLLFSTERVAGGWEDIPEKWVISFTLDLT